MALSLLAANNAQTVLAAGISSTATTLTVNTGTGALFPSPVSGTSYFKLTLIDAATGQLTEIVHVTARSGDTMTIARAQEGTVARAWSANDLAANMLTAGTLLLLAPLDTPALTGTPTAPTASSATSTTQIATTAFVHAITDLLAPLGSPALTGTPTAPTAAATISTTQLATTAFVHAASAGVVGDARNLSMSVTSSSATATVTADEITVSTGLGGSVWRIGSFSKTINLGTTGVGGMDTGTVPTTGYVGIYAILNPTTGASALLAVNATSSVVPEIYGGANMPAGYTASALVSVWGIAASKFIPGSQTGRTIKTQQLNLLTTSTPITTPTALTISPGAPLNTRKIQLSLNITQSTSGNGVGLVLQSDATGIGAIGQLSATSSGTSANGMYCEISLMTQGQIYYVMNNTSSASYTVKSLGYDI